jgi:excisionase family DNA binding protein
VNADRLSIAVPPELEERIAERAAEIVLERLGQIADNGASPYLTIPEAAEFLRAKRHRVDDLLSSGRLTRHKEGSRTLVLRAELEAYMRGEPTGRRARLT